ncbi:lipopolysaccharide biosynthesis protein [Labrys wisconsinensis]|uniref:O-antigen/teichoic acid export membrane protein n=1 Tax=Labrys wisconsinensis TaxID=425677 RepID=A0ABU0IZ39_9HYPH|nr:oligosaccharide flippase family protein [Labrys wisconsinensis]MDQ0467276.1 O-antigen/teichoic acid export membrane protein [Labrys wisconsinensis]
MTLVRQTATYFVANAGSAAFGLLNVVVFTRLFGPAEYGVYVIGNGLAAILGALLFTWLKQAILREEAKADGTDIRGTVLLGFGLSCLAFPVIYIVASRLVALEGRAVAASILLALCVGFFELGQELLRARLQAGLYMRATLVRAVLVSAFGVAVTFFAGGLGLLLSGAAAYLASAGLTLRGVWTGAKLRLRDPRLWPLAVWGFPLTVSISVLALSSAIDRFIVAHILGAAAAGEYGASVDLVRQALIIPAISASSAFVPMAVRLLANEGPAATRRHLDDCLELLLAVTLPACIGFAVTAPHIADLILGPDFRPTAHAIMPIVAVAVVFQIATQQYLHIGFLLANRNVFYIVNTASTLAFNVVATSLLIGVLGVAGAAWGRVATEAFGFLNALILARWAFPMPLPPLRIARVAAAVAVMAVVVAALDRLLPAALDRVSLALLIPAGALAYVAACWVLDVAQVRARLGRTLAARFGAGQGAGALQPGERQG